MLKRETRILGLSAAGIGESLIVIGAIYRGSLWLDGVVTAIVDPSDRDLEKEIATVIKNTKQFPQLHATIVSRGLFGKLSLGNLARHLRIPVITSYQRIGKTRMPTSFSNVNRSHLIVNTKKLVLLYAGKMRDEAQKLYTIGCAGSEDVPEAVRVADRLVREVRSTTLPMGRSENGQIEQSPSSH